MSRLGSNRATRGRGVQFPEERSTKVNEGLKGRKREKGVEEARHYLKKIKKIPFTTRGRFGGVIIPRMILVFFGTDIWICLAAAIGDSCRYYLQNKNNLKVSQRNQGHPTTD